MSTLSPTPSGSSPHTRGAHVGEAADTRAFGIIPAYAGSTVSLFAILSVATGIIPAYAGSTHVREGISRCPRDHPRIRGEHQFEMSMPFMIMGSSPHTRGALEKPGHWNRYCGIIPAYAGSTYLVLSVSRSLRDHPRIRGEHRVLHRGRAGRVGSSPHTRGARYTTQEGAQPAQDHPRIRGEHASNALPFFNLMGSSPHTRGARTNDGGLHELYGIIPAYAGSTRCVQSNARLHGDHPRIRGEHTTRPRTRRTARGSSPHTRGAHEVDKPKPLGDGIIPAYAGSTRRRTRYRTGCWDHPRIRGEHSETPAALVESVGSSPHTRGARKADARRAVLRGIIPAYAGSTESPIRRWRSSRDHPRIRGEH